MRTDEDMTEIPEWAIAYVNEAIGPFRIVHTHRDNRGRTGVWEVESDRGRFFFKTHNRRYKFGSEVHAYRHWGGAFKQYLPELVGVLDTSEYFGVLTRAVNARPLREIQISEDLQTAIYYETGVCLRGLHTMSGEEWPWFGCAVDDMSGRSLSREQGANAGRETNPVAVATADLQRAVEQRSQAGELTREETEACKVAHALVEAFAGESPVPTNHDYTPGNWLVGSDGQLVAIIDLEDMFYGFRIDPFVRLEAEYFPAMSLRTSFIAGYGTDLPTLQPEQMAVKLTILALGFLTAGIKGDERQRERGERVLEAARKFSEKY